MLWMCAIKAQTIIMMKNLESETLCVSYIGPVAVEDIKFEVVTRDKLCQEKLFLKLLRKQQKDVELMKKRHQKERGLMQRAHCTVVDKLVATHDKEKTATEKSVEKKLKKNR